MARRRFRLGGGALGTQPRDKRREPGGGKCAEGGAEIRRREEKAAKDPARDLPEMLSEAELKRRFGGVGGPKYKETLQLIERRLAGLALYR